jgi:hypothetical protein
VATQTKIRRGANSFFDKKSVDLGHPSPRIIQGLGVATNFKKSLSIKLFYPMTIMPSLAIDFMMP